MHDCPDCGSACYCDGEDHDNGMFDDCEHFLTDECQASCADGEDD